MKTRALIAWSDADVALAGAVLMDLAFAGKVDSDQDNLFILQRSSEAPEEQPLALRLLGHWGGCVRLDIALDELVSRIGDLRSATVSSLASRDINLSFCSRVSGDFRHVAWNGSQVREALALQEELKGLVESEELPKPAHASLISLLGACEIAGPFLGGRAHEKWTTQHRERLDSIRRMDLVGRAVAETVSRLRCRLRAFLLDADQSDSATAESRKTHGPRVSYTRSRVTWEWRVFWPEGEAVELPPSWDGFGIDSDSEAELLEDNYLLVHGKNDNIKLRGSGLKIKRMVEACHGFIAYGSSVKFQFPEKTATLAKIFPRLIEVTADLHSSDDLIEIMSATGYQPRVLMVSKARRVQSMIFGVQIEFSRVSVNGRAFNSISLESRYLTALRILARNLPIGAGQVAGYSEFLDCIVRMN